MELRLNAESQHLEITCKLKQLNTKYSKTLLIDDNRQKLDKFCNNLVAQQLQTRRKAKQSKAKWGKNAREFVASSKTIE